MSKKRLTYIVLSIFLILTGLSAFLPGLGSLGMVISILAIAAGVLILISMPGGARSIGWILAAIYLIARGLIGLVGFRFNGIDVVMAVLALAAGILLLLRARNVFSKLGFFLFCVWLILVGLAYFISFGDLSILIPIAAIASGVLMLLIR